MSILPRVARFIVSRSMVERLDTNSLLLAGIVGDHLARYQFALPKVRGKIVLDIASGAGYGSDLLAQSAKKVIGVDLDPATVKLAQEKYQRKNLSFLSINGFYFLKKTPKLF